MRRHTELRARHCDKCGLGLAANQFTSTCPRCFPGRPTKPGFYWAIWTSPAAGTHEATEMDFSVNGWEVVEVRENFIGDPCEADAAEKFYVSVPGVREVQWLENFTWGDGPLPSPEGKR